MMRSTPQPVVSVVIPFFDSIGALERALRSVRAQDFKEAVETIVVVDGSSEDMTSISAQFPEVRLFYQDNAGPGSARNHGIDVSNGEFIAFLDADDHWLPKKLSTQVSAMRRHSAAWSQHSYVVSSMDSTVLRSVDTSRYAGWVLRQTYLSFRVQTSAVMVRRTSLETPRLRFGEDRVGEDGWFYARMAARYPLIAIEEALGHFTWHGSNAGGRADIQLWSRARIWQENKQVIRTVLPPAGWLAYHWCGLAIQILRYPRNSPPENANELLARAIYAPSYIVFQTLAKWSSS